MRIVLDANVIVSALINAESVPDRVFRAWEQDAYTLITSPALLAELERVLFYPRIRSRLPFDDAGVREIVTDIAIRSEVLKPRGTIDAVERDPADNRILEAAVAGYADYIVTGDRDLLEVGRYDRVEIVTPSVFLAILSIGEQRDL